MCPIFIDKFRQYDNFQNLLNVATPEELLILTDYQNEAVRCYAFWGLPMDDPSVLFPIIINHLDDESYVETFRGCIKSAEMVGDFFINKVTNSYQPQVIQYLQEKKYTQPVGLLDSTQIAFLDSILIYGSYKLKARDVAIERIKTIESNYPRLRELVIEENNQNAVVALARFQKEQDIDLIFNNRSDKEPDWLKYKYTYRAISNFLHPKFMILLRSNLIKNLDKTHYSTEWKELYKAIASYENKEAAQLLLIPFTEVKHTNMREYHINYIFSAVKEHKVPVFHILLWKLWTEERKIMPDVLEYFLKTCPDEMYESAKVALRNLKELRNANLGLSITDDHKIDSVVVSLLNLVIERESNEALKLISENLRIAGSSWFSVFSEATTKIKNPNFVKPLFDRLKFESDMSIILNATEALIAYDNEEINQSIISIHKKRTKFLKKWQRKKFDKLLKKHNLL